MRDYKYIVDTHSLVWYFTGDRRLSKKVKKILHEAEQQMSEIIIPAIVLLEAIDIGEKKKVRFEMEKLFDFIESKDSFRVISLDFDLIKDIPETGKGLDLHDRIILAVGKVYQGIILTRDSEIKKQAETIW